MTEQSSQRIEDPEKAHIMALAGNQDRVDAVRARDALALSEGLPQAFDDENDPDGRFREDKLQFEEDLKLKAEGADAIAEIEEERAGRDFDTQKK